MKAFISFPVFHQSKTSFISTLTPLSIRHSSIQIYSISKSIKPCAQLVGMPEGFGQNLQPSDNEVLLAELRYSDPSLLPSLVQNSLDRLDEDFYDYLEQQISNSKDIEERDTLRSLRDAITDVMKTLLQAINDNNDQSQQQQQQTIDVGNSQDIAQATYDELIDKMITSIDPNDDSSLITAVNVSYDRIDMTLLERLQQRITSNKSDSPHLIQLRDTINDTMNERIAKAAESVKIVLSSADPASMRKQIDSLARKGKIDDAFILLIQANLDQANTANATQAIQVLTLVLNHASSVKDITLNPEIKLIRSLLRTDDEQARKDILMENLKPRSSVQTLDGNPTSGVKVDGKKFVIALRKLIEEFGNVDEKFILKLSKIGEESEAIARKLFDMEDKDVQDLQDEAFHKRSVSIWDLERIELEEEVRGAKAAWEGKLGDIPEGFNEEGKLQI